MNTPNIRLAVGHGFGHGSPRPCALCDQGALDDNAGELRPVLFEGPPGFERERLICDSCLQERAPEAWDRLRLHRDELAEKEQRRANLRGRRERLVALRAEAAELIERRTAWFEEHAADLSLGELLNECAQILAAVDVERRVADLITAADRAAWHA